MLTDIFGFKYNSYGELSEKIPSYGDVMTVCDFRYRVRIGMFNQCDGHGYYSNGDDMYPLTNCFSDIPIELIDVVTHVVWFNK